MAMPTGFLEFKRKEMPKRPVGERVNDCCEIEQLVPEESLEEQAARCMDCGVPFCHLMGCPLRNTIPEFNDLVFRKQWRQALDLLHSTNNFPEITGRVCPALCEAACTLGANDEPVTIRQIELHLVERGWREGWIRPQPAAVQTGKRVAVIGSGPAGLAAAQQLVRAGHKVRVFESADRIGGVLRYGIPDFKLEKWILDRRIHQMKVEGIDFVCDVRVGDDVSIGYLKRTYDAVLLASGARVPRDIEAKGRDLKGIYFALDFLMQQNHRVAGDFIPADQKILARDKHVLVIGGGDTGADCVGTAIRQGARDILQIEILPRPPAERDPSTPWPLWPSVLRTSSSHEEGCTRQWSILAKEFVGCDGHVCAMRGVEIEWKKDPSTGRLSFTEIPGSEFQAPADLVLLALGFTKEGNATVLNAFGIVTTASCDPVLDENFMSSVPGIFVAGDLSRGASLVVRAMLDGREAADRIDKFLRANCSLVKAA